MNKKDIVIEVQMLIRKPAQDVFLAFVDPEITKNFWFTKGSALLEKGRTVSWEWEMYGVSTAVTVLDILPNEKISVSWGEPKTNIDFLFQSIDAQSTYLRIQNYGFEDLDDSTLMSFIIDSTGGFTTVIDGLKAYLEKGISLNLIADKFPMGV
ncbi:SRPBCC domain-containing protein [Sphingobacterium sp. SYP-B4668]|uniref:SRPBCC domain-containing protein n=1 Tax=Sphingobacterium sp. SYP-B4668 TaxID=2996035 RepID=UPI0022DD9319|nr:SRPBCC domain-containing protein [Sphingobacterium sp. SYP-B4668]